MERTQKLHDDVISKVKGFISWEHYLQGNTWTDFVLWETEEDAENAMTVGQGEKSDRGILCLYPNEYMQDAGFKICEKVLTAL